MFKYNSQLIDAKRVRKYEEELNMDGSWAPGFTTEHETTPPGITCTTPPQLCSENESMFGDGTIGHKNSSNDESVTSSPSEDLLTESPEKNDISDGYVTLPLKSESLKSEENYIACHSTTGLQVTNAQTRSGEAFSEFFSAASLGDHDENDRICPEAHDSASIIANVDQIAAQVCGVDVDSVHMGVDLSLSMASTPESTDVKPDLEATPADRNNSRLLSNTSQGGRFSFAESRSPIVSSSFARLQVKRVPNSARWLARCFNTCILVSRQEFTSAQVMIEEASVYFQCMVQERDYLLLTAPILLLSVLQTHGQSGLAQVFVRNALDISTFTLGDNDPIVLVLRWLDAAASRTLDHCHVGSETLSNVLYSLERSNGVNHPYSLAARYALAFSFTLEDKNSEAEQQLGHVYEGSELTFGSCHIQTVSALNLLARIFSVSGRPEEAEATWLTSLERSKEHLGENHPQRLETKRRLASHYVMVKKLDLAEPLYIDVLEGRAQMLGHKHPYTLGSLEDLEKLLRTRGREDEAQQIRVRFDNSCEPNDYLVREPKAY